MYSTNHREFITPAKSHKKDNQEVSNPFMFFCYIAIALVLPCMKYSILFRYKNINVRSYSAYNFDFISPDFQPYFFRPTFFPHLIIILLNITPLKFVKFFIDHTLRIISFPPHLVSPQKARAMKRNVEADKGFLKPSKLS